MTLASPSTRSGSAWRRPSSVAQDSEHLALVWLSSGSPATALRIADTGFGHRWVLDGAVLGKAAELFLWPPTPGRHRLSVIGPDGRIFDTVTFLVRGAAVAERMGRAGTPMDR